MDVDPFDYKAAWKISFGILVLLVVISAYWYNYVWKVEAPLEVGEDTQKEWEAKREAYLRAQEEKMRQFVETEEFAQIRKEEEEREKSNQKAKPLRNIGGGRNLNANNQTFEPQPYRRPSPFNTWGRGGGGGG